MNTRKNIRLNAEIYKQPERVVHINICTANRKKLFISNQIYQSVAESIEAMNQHGVEILAWVIMPDHLHLLLRNIAADIQALIPRWKRSSARPLVEAGRTAPVWQRGFHDHFLRDDESVNDAALYIWHNPVRAGLCDTPSDWKWLGGELWKGMTADGDAHPAVGSISPSAASETDILYMNKALQQAEIAAENGEVPVGAVLVTGDGQQFAAHNAPITTHDATAHAEMRVIRMACEAMQNYRLTDATLYVTLEPCTMCAGAIVHARIGRVVYGAPDPKTGAVESLAHVLSDARLNHQPEVTSGILREACGDLLKSFFRERRGRG